MTQASGDGRVTGWFEVGRPLPSRGVRSCSVQVGLRPLFAFECWLDRGYAASRFEFTFGLSVGPWRYVFDWRPVRMTPHAHRPSGEFR